MIDIRLDIESERNAIAVALVDPAQLPELASRLSPSDFSAGNAPIWQAIHTLFADDREVNQISVAHQLGDLLNEIGGQTYLSQLIRECPTTIGANWYADEILRQSKARDVVQAAAKIQAIALDTDWRTAVDRGMELLIHVASERGGTTETQTAEEVISGGLWDEIEEHMEDPKRLRGIPTGWSTFDRYLSGLVKKRVHLYGAETSLGKSLWAHDLIRRVTAKGAKVLIFSTEMGNSEVARRIVYQEAGIDSFDRTRSGYTSVDRENVRDAMERIRRRPLVFCERGDLSLGWLRSETRRIKAKLSGLDIVVIDHMDMMSGSGQSRTSQLEGITGGIKALAMGEDVAVIEVSHLSRVTEFNKSSKSARFRNSESKAQDADIAWFLTPVNDVGEVMTSDAARLELSSLDRLNVLLEITKQRHGKVGVIPMTLNWKRGGRYEERDR